MSRLRIVVSGAPHSGKTTLVDGLSSRGVRTVPESAMEVIGRGRDELGLEGFAAWRREHASEFVARIVRVQFARESEVGGTGVDVVFDRGLIDCGAYARMLDVVCPTHLSHEDLRGRYDIALLLRIVEPFAPRSESGRTSTLEGARAAERYLFDAYERSGIPTVVVPACPVDERIAFVLAALDEFRRRSRSTV